jgi:hypothetical protein
MRKAGNMSEALQGHSRPALGGIVGGEANFPTQGDGRQRAVDGGRHVIVQRVIGFGAAGFGAEMGEEARPQHTRVADQNAERRRAAEVRQLESVIDRLVVKADPKRMHEIEARLSAWRGQVRDHPIPG